MGGVQSWARTVGAVLADRGHEVQYWEPGLPAPSPAELGIFANVHLTEPVLQFVERSVGVCHGIIPDEKPIDGRVDRWVFVSEGVRNHWDVPGEIVRQPIDTFFWRPNRDTDARTGGAVRFSYRRNGLPYAEKVSTKLGFAFKHVHSASPDQAREILQNAQLVFASGRAALEAMACGAPTVIYDNRSAYQPPLLGEYIPSQMRQSYSGRRGIANPNEKQLVEVITKTVLSADPSFWRQWVLAQHEAVRRTAQLIEVQP